MVRVNAPALSLEASGKLGGAVVFARWKGRPYARVLVVPANPRSGGQVGMRAMLKWLSTQWAGLASGVKSTWETMAKSLVISPFNAYTHVNQARWRNFKAPGQDSTIAETGTQPTLGTLAATAGVRSITVTQPITAAGDGWGVLFFSKTTSSISTSFDCLKYIGAIVGTANVVFVYSPLAPGTYYFKIRAFTKEGALGSESSEVSATVT